MNGGEGERRRGDVSCSHRAGSAIEELKSEPGNRLLTIPAVSMLEGRWFFLRDGVSGNPKFP
jgi:hypothetical protein